MSGDTKGFSSIHVSSNQIQFGWDRTREPAIVVDAGAEITLDVPDAGGGQLGPTTTANDMNHLNFERVNPTCGPIFVSGAKAGDVLQVDVLSLQLGHFGWTALIPGFGLLADKFAEPWLNIWELRANAATFRDGITIPLEPFCGVIGVAPAEHGVHSVVPPRRVGGNMDIKQLGAGSSLYLPIEVDGALVGIGDTHAAQGDGEVCGTAIESPMQVTLRLTVRHDLAIDGPEFDVRRPLERPSAAAAGYHASTGIGPDLLQASREAIDRMIAFICAHYRLSPEEAYALCSIVVDLKVSEVVDLPNWVVSAFLPKDIFK